MKKFTQLDFEGFEVDEYDRRICPRGEIITHYAKN